MFCTVPPSSGQLKGLSFCFRPKVSVSVGAEMFRQKLTFRPKLPLFRPKLPSFGRDSLFRFRLSAEIAGFKTPSFGFGRNSFGWPLPGRPENKRSTTSCGLRVKLYLTTLSHRRIFWGPCRLPCAASSATSAPPFLRKRPRDSRCTPSGRRWPQS